MQIATKGVLGGALQLTSSNIDMTLGNVLILQLSSVFVGPANI